MSDERAPPPSYSDLFDTDYVAPLSVICAEGDEEATGDIHNYNGEGSGEVDDVNTSSHTPVNDEHNVHVDIQSNGDSNYTVNVGENDTESVDSSPQRSGAEQESSSPHISGAEQDNEVTVHERRSRSIDSEEISNNCHAVQQCDSSGRDTTNEGSGDRIQHVAPPTYAAVLGITESDSNVEDPPTYQDLIEDFSTEDNISSISEHDDGITNGNRSMNNESPPEYGEAVTTLVISGLSPQPADHTYYEIDTSNVTIGLDHVDETDSSPEGILRTYDPTVDLDHFIHNRESNEQHSAATDDYDKSKQIKIYYRILVCFVMCVIPVLSILVVLCGVYIQSVCEDQISAYSCAVSEGHFVCERTSTVIVIGALGLISLFIMWDVYVFSIIMISTILVMILFELIHVQFYNTTDKYTENTSRQIWEEMKQCHGGNHTDECWNYFTRDFCPNWSLVEDTICSLTSLPPYTTPESSTLPQYANNSMVVISNCTGEFSYYVEDVYHDYMDKTWVPGLILIIVSILVVTLVIYMNKKKEEWQMWIMYNQKPCKYCLCGEEIVTDIPQAENIQIRSYNNFVDTTDKTVHRTRATSI